MIQTQNTIAARMLISDSPAKRNNKLASYLVALLKVARKIVGASTSSAIKVSCSVDVHKAGLIKHDYISDSTCKRY